MRALLRLAACAAVLAPIACAEQSSPGGSPEAGGSHSGFAAEAAAYMQTAWPADGPGAAVIVTQNGETVFAGAQGLADIETGAKLTPDSVFRIGSITKQISAAVLMQLVEEGKVNLDDPVTVYLPDYPAPDTITVRKLLNHTSGVQSYTSIPGLMDAANTARPYTTEEMIALFKDHPLTFEPGARYSYNNSAYVLVGAVIEKATGAPWHEEVDRRIAEPLGLKTLRYGVFEDETPNMAKGYTGGDAPKPAQIIHMSVPHAAGALIANVKDLAVWEEALHSGKVVSPESYAMMTAPTTLNDGKVSQYGFGLSNFEVRGRKTVGHSGGIFGFGTFSLYIPEKDLFVAVFGNSDSPATSPSTAVRRIAALALGDPYPTFVAASVDPATLEPVFGVYALDEQTRSFYARDGKLYMRAGDAGPEAEVSAAGDDRFFYSEGGLTWFRVVRAEDGAHRMEFHPEGAEEPVIATRTGPAPA